jgi:hypothetical protein
MTPRRRCKGRTRAGKRCKAAPLKGREHCSAHDPVSPGSTRFGSAEQASRAGAQGGRPRVPGATETARRLVEQNVGALLTPHFRVLGYDVIDTPDGLTLAPVAGGGAKLHATFEGEVLVSRHDDLGAMIAAAERLMDRALGKPRQAVEHSGYHGGPIEHAHDLRGLAADDLEQLEQILSKAASSAGEPPVAG